MVEMCDWKKKEGLVKDRWKRMTSSFENKDHYKTIAENRKARFDFELKETLEAGIVLTGTEVKSLRKNHCSIAESFVGEMSHGPDAGSLVLFNALIPVYEQARVFNHEPRAPRKLLLHKKDMNKWLGLIRKKRLTIVPLRLYFNHKGLVKVKIALAQGKHTVDKREATKNRDWNRQKSRLLKHHQSTVRERCASS